MVFISILVIAALCCFGVSILYGAPYLPTLSKQVEVALDLLDLKHGQTMIELGCGDGKVMIAAARRGWTVVGYEVNPVMAAVAWIRTRRYRQQVTVVWGNFFNKTLPPAEGVFSFIMPRFMPAVNEKLLQSDSTSIRLASFAFTIPDKKPVQRKDGVFLYTYE